MPAEAGSPLIHPLGCPALPEGRLAREALAVIIRLRVELMLCNQLSFVHQTLQRMGKR